MMMSWLRALGLALVVGAAGAGSAEAKWLRAETPHFILYSDGPERELRDYAAQLEIFDAALRLFHPATEEGGKLEIYLVKNGFALQKASPRVQGIAGFYEARPDGTFALARRDGEQYTDNTIFHEYTHHFMLHYFSYPYPSWLIEGWAEYFGESEVHDDRIEVGLPNNGRASELHEWWYDSTKLFGRPRSEIDPDYIPLFYARAWLLTHFMLSDETRRKQLTAYMRAVGDGGDPVKSLEETLGYDMETLDRNLKAYAKGRLPYQTIKRGQAPAPVSLSELPPSADDLLLKRLHLISGVADKDKDSTLKEIVRLASKHPNDRLAQLTLARAHIILGDPQEAESALRPFLAAEDAEAFLLMGMRYLWAGDRDEANRRSLYAQARPWLAQAHKANPDSYETLYAFARSRSHDPDYPTEQTLEVLLQAHELAPQVEEITFATAEALVARDDHAHAAVLLRMLANDPHGGDLAKAAKALLDQLSGVNVRPN